MAKGKKTGGRDFQPGNDFGQGRPPVPEDLKHSRSLNRIQFERTLNKYVHLTGREISQALENAESNSILEMIVAKILDKAFNEGDTRRLEFVLERLIGKPQPQPEGMIQNDKTFVSHVKSFEEFCEDSGYPSPYPKQIEMMEFTINDPDEKPRIILGAPGYGKTDYCVILGVSYKIYKNWKEGLHLNRETADTTLLMTKSTERNTAICKEVSDVLTVNGVPLEKNNSRSIRVEGLQGKEDSLSTITVKAVSLRGRHPKRAIMEDVVTEDDTSEAARTIAEKKYSELVKRTKNIAIVGQPAHHYDLYAKLRPLLKKLEIPHGQIPELDHDLDAMKLAGVDPGSIEMSYHLKIPAEGSAIFSQIKFIDKMSHGDSVAFIDPSDGGDYTAVTIFRGIGSHIHFEGHCWKKAWYLCLDDMVPILKAKSVRRLCFETNKHGEQPIDQLRELFKKMNFPCGVSGKFSDSNKHAVIKAAGSISHLLHLSKESSQLYTDQVVKYEYKAKFDDAPDSLARGLEWLGLISGKK